MGGKHLLGLVDEGLSSEIFQLKIYLCSQNVCQQKHSSRVLWSQSSQWTLLAMVEWVVDAS